MSSPRIIGGTAKGMRLQSVPGDSTRPVTDMVKEALFNILGTDVPGSTWLDLFSGTGSIGIEALSRGAKFARLNDLNRRAVETLRANLTHTRLSDNGQVTHLDAFSLLRQSPDRAFDYIYIAPPQYQELWQRAVELLDENPGWLAEDGLVVVQIDPREHRQLDLRSFQQVEERKYGNTLLVFYERVLPEQGGQGSGCAA